MSDEIEITDIDVVESKSEQAVTDDSNDLGAPDFSSLIDDDLEITEADFSQDKVAKAKKGLKPSFAVKKLMPTLFAVIARVKGPHWALDDEEVEEFSDSLDECLDYYYPELDGLPPWLLLAVSGGSIMLPRLIIDGFSDDEKAALEEVEKEVNQPSKPKQKVIGEGTVLQAKAVT